MAVIILAQVTGAGFDDSRAIFNTILMESAMLNPGMISMIELTDIVNNKYLDPIQQVWHGRRGDQQSPRARVSSFRNSKALRSNDRPSTRGHHKKFRHPSPFISMWQHIQQASSAASQVKQVLSKHLNPDDELLGGAEVFFDTFFQERYVSGQLFPSFVADDLVINSYFNPSLVLFMEELLSSQSCFSLMSIPESLLQDDAIVSVTYGQVFQEITRSSLSAIPIGIYRSPTRANDAQSPFVFTCPPVDTIMCELDQIYVIMNHKSLHQQAAKIQKSVRQHIFPKSTTNLSSFVRLASLSVGSKMEKS